MTCFIHVYSTLTVKSCQCRILADSSSEDTSENALEDEPKQENSPDLFLSLGLGQAPQQSIDPKAEVPRQEAVTRRGLGVGWGGGREGGKAGRADGATVLTLQPGRGC